MIQIAIVEDEEIYVKQLTEYIRKYQTERGRSIKVTVYQKLRRTKFSLVQEPLSKKIKDAMNVAVISTLARGRN